MNSNDYLQEITFQILRLRRIAAFSRYHLRIQITVEHQHSFFYGPRRYDWLFFFPIRSTFATNGSSLTCGAVLTTGEPLYPRESLRLLEEVALRNMRQDRTLYFPRSSESGVSHISDLIF